ncbi:phage holin family protein [Pseudonocardia halophobica]|uniref:Membrane protein n=1 Tax=Pseudonocardia halophobica TaxID=29401 RepID=A0A9W6LAV0_9PSEU|nr:phage holin family protein [Pseudonocardia halophobica]GLL14780.1 membrane protein [Pseudonocardia halophobica]
MNRTGPIVRDYRATPVERGPLLRGGRVVARVVLVWALVTAALHLLDVWLTGFAMAGWWQPTVCALLLGLLTAVVWPLVLRVALPLALFTLGLGSFVLLAAAVLAIFWLVPGVELTNIRTAFVVVVVMTVVNAVATSLLAVDEDELFFRRAVRRSRRSAAPEQQTPGVLFLQIDGLGHDTARRAVRDGTMPTLARWLAEGSHTLQHWTTDWSSQTGASVSGILHGSNHDILGFRWYEKDRDHVMACAHPADAAEIEGRHSDGRGLLAVDGASRGNLFTGDAPHYSLTMSTVTVLGGKRSARRRDHVGGGYWAYFANPVNGIRTFAGALVDAVREVVEASSQRRADVRPRTHRGGLYPLARPGTTVIARDVVVSALIEDMLAGRPVAYADFLGYDEVAHHSGIERFDSLAVLRTIDQQIGRLHRAAQLAPRPYLVVCLSDHGQTQGQAFADRFGESIEQYVGRLCGAPPPRPRRRLFGRTPAERSTRRAAEGWQVGAALAEASSGGGFVARRLRARVEKAGASPAKHRTESGKPGEVVRAAPGVVVCASGHVAMVSFTEHEGRVELETIEREFPDLLPSLVDHPGIGFVLVRSREHGAVVLGRDGVHRLASGAVVGDDPLADYGEHAPDLVRRVDTFPHCPDIMINSRYDPATDDASPFEPHVGSHGGLGGPQSRGFLLAPAELADPGEIVGAEHLHRVFRGWLTDLGHPEPATDRPAPQVADVAEERAARVR